MIHTYIKFTAGIALGAFSADASELLDESGTLGKRKAEEADKRLDLDQERILKGREEEANKTEITDHLKFLADQKVQVLRSIN